MTSVARICSIQDCGRKHEAHGYCKLHYRRSKDGRPMDGSKPPKPKCSVPDCDRDARSRGYCMSHYKTRYYNTRTNPKNTCTLGSCRKPHHARGLCYKHYLRDYSNVTSPEVDNARFIGRSCLISGCENVAGPRYGLCKSHTNWAGKYALSTVQAIQILNSGYPCDICGVILSAKNINIDHDHSCCPGQATCGNCVRGLLCRACNRGIGSFSESLGNLQRAVSYLSGVEL